MASAARVEGLEKSALALCKFALIAIFMTGFVGYFTVNRIWPNFYYLGLKGFYEFDAQDRPRGYNTWLTFAISPAAQATPAASRLAHK